LRASKDFVDSLQWKILSTLEYLLSINGVILSILQEIKSFKEWRGESYESVGKKRVGLRW
jgi:hypothetical protein